MKDATRDEAIQWCIDNNVDFTNPTFPPPKGWQWGETNEPCHILTTIFTITKYEDIQHEDVLAAVGYHLWELLRPTTED